MSAFTREDLKAAVAAGVMTEAQAASVIALAQEREGLRAARTDVEEPFELFKGFNEVFIVIGLSILYVGWAGITGFSLLGATRGYVLGLVLSLVAMGVLTVLSMYFTLKRRMVAPSNALCVMFALSTIQLGLSLAAWMDFNLQPSWALAGAVTAVLMTAHYVYFRVPFAVALIALGIIATAFAIATMGGALPLGLTDFFLLSAGGPFAYVTIGLGVLALIVAMIFDMSDPHRVTRRAESGFWLHVISGPAIVNTVALTLFQNGTLTAQMTLVVFVAVMALFAIVIDRRSFLVSGVGYIVALSISVVEGNQAFFVILVLGMVLVLLGAQWERLRGWIMRALPAFPGKTKLPPWATEVAT